MPVAIVVLSAVTVLFGIALLIAVRMASEFRRELEKMRFARRSQSTRYGQITEQFMPWASNYPYDPSGFRFLGSPIDGVQFEDDRVILMEFKTAESSLTSTQRNIRELVRRGKVGFEEFRLS